MQLLGTITALVPPIWGTYYLNVHRWKVEPWEYFCPLEVDIRWRYCALTQCSSMVYCSVVIYCSIKFNILCSISFNVRCSIFNVLYTMSFCSLFTLQGVINVPVFKRCYNQCSTFFVVGFKNLVGLLFSSHKWLYPLVVPSLVPCLPPTSACTHQ